LRSTTKSDIFQWLVIPVLQLVVGYLTSDQKFNLPNTHQKFNHQILFLYSEKQNNWHTIRQKFRLTPGRESWPGTFQDKRTRLIIASQTFNFIISTSQILCFITITSLTFWSKIPNRKLLGF